jgi:large subunit ribosomal protein L6
MSRIGKKTIPLPDGVKITMKGREVWAEGPKGKLSVALSPGIDVAVVDAKEIRVSRATDERRLRALHGTTRALLANMVTGVTTGFTKVLQLWGVGYSAEVKGKTVSLSVGFCHKVDIPVPDGLEVKTERVSIEGTNVWQIAVSGIDRQALGQLAAVIRASRPPEPYKGKGIRYLNERIIRKAGKSFQSGA